MIDFLLALYCRNYCASFPDGGLIVRPGSPLSWLPPFPTPAPTQAPPPVRDRPPRAAVRRTPNARVPLGGGGVNVCLGAHLARLEISCMLREILRRLPDIELAEPAARMRSDFINGIKRMNVRYTPA